MSALRVVLVEDDPHQAEYNGLQIEAWVPGVELEIVSTESEFRRRLEAGAWSKPAARPHAFLLDVMIQWTTPNPGMQAPPRDVVDEGYFRAGLRCAAKLLAAFRTEPRPRIALLTVLDRADLEIPAGVEFFNKTDLIAVKQWLLEGPYLSGGGIQHTSKH